MKVRCCMVGLSLTMLAVSMILMVMHLKMVTTTSVAKMMVLWLPVGYLWTSLTMKQPAITKSLLYSMMMKTRAVGSTSNPMVRRSKLKAMISRRARPSMVRNMSLISTVLWLLSGLWMLRRLLMQAYVTLTVLRLLTAMLEPLSTHICGDTSTLLKMVPA